MKSHHSDYAYCGLILNMRCSVSNKTNTIIVFIFHVSPDQQFFNSSSYFFFIYILFIYIKNCSNSLYERFVIELVQHNVSTLFMLFNKFVLSIFYTKKYIHFFAGSRNYTFFAKHCRLGQV